MSVTIQQVKDNLKGLNGGASIDDVTNLYELMGRASIVLLSEIDPITTIRKQQLSQFVHDDLQNYALPSDYKKLIDLAPVESRSSSDRAHRTNVESFSSQLSLENKRISIESNDGTKYIRINWKDNPSTTFHTMDSLTSNGTIAVVGTASGLKANTQYKLSGTASIEFDIAASGDGIQCTGMTAVNLSDDEEYADVIIPVYIPSSTALSRITSFTYIKGNDLATNYWTFTAQTTQADGTSFVVGWNFLVFPWSTATETGSVTNTAFDAWKLTVATTGAVSNMRVDNILVSLGSLFEMKYYSQFIFKNTSGTWISQPTSDDDTCVLDGTALQMYYDKCLIAISQQSKRSEKDYAFAVNEVSVLKKEHKGEYPSQSKKQVDTYWSKPRYGR